MLIIARLAMLVTVSLIICPVSLAQNSANAPTTSRNIAPAPVTQPLPRNNVQTPPTPSSGARHGGGQHSSAVTQKQVNAPNTLGGNQNVNIGVGIGPAQRPSNHVVPSPATPTQAITQGQPRPSQNAPQHLKIHVQKPTEIPKPPTVPAPGKTISTGNEKGQFIRPPIVKEPGYKTMPAPSFPGRRYYLPRPIGKVPDPSKSGMRLHNVKSGAVSPEKEAQTSNLQLQQTLRNLTAPSSSVPPTVSAETMKNLTAPTVTPSSQTGAVSATSANLAGAPQALLTSTGGSKPLSSTVWKAEIQALQGTDLSRYNIYVGKGYAPEQALGLVKVFRNLDAQNQKSTTTTATGSQAAPASQAIAVSAPVVSTLAISAAAVQAAPASVPASAPAKPQEKITVQMGGAGTEFKMTKVGTDKYTFEVVGSSKGDRFLDGVKRDGSDVGLGTQGGNGTVWKVHEERGGKVRLECVNCSGNDKYLDGSRSGAADQLGLAIKSNSGTLWTINKHSNGTVTLQCAEKDSGPKLLSLKTEIITPPASPTPTPLPVAASPAPAPMVTAAPAPTASASSSTPVSVASTASASTPEKNTFQMADSGTQFKMNKVGSDKYTFEVVGSNKGDKFLDGVKRDGAEVGLGTQGGTGTVWKVHEERNGLVRLECVQCSGNDRFLDGSRSGGANQLGLAIKSNSGTLWKMNKGANGTVTFECAEKNSGPKLLSLKTDIPNAPTIAVPVASKPSEPTKSEPVKTDTSKKNDSKPEQKVSSGKSPDSSSDVVMGSVGTQFILHDKGNDTFTIEVVGVNKSAKYLDGAKSEGDAVGLGIAGNKGTLWKAEKDRDGNTRFRCVDCSGSTVYLDGIQSGNATEVGLGIKGNTGTEWKMVAQPDGKTALQSADVKSGDKFLTLVVDGKNVAPSVAYEPKKETQIKVVNPSTATDARITVSRGNESETKINVSSAHSSENLTVITKSINGEKINVVTSTQGAEKIVLRIQTDNNGVNHTLDSLRQTNPGGTTELIIPAGAKLLETTAHYNVWVSDASLNETVKMLIPQLETSFRAATNVIGSPYVPADKHRINLLFDKDGSTMSAYGTGEHGAGEHLYGTNVIKINARSGTEQNLSAMLTTTAHETAHFIFQENAIVTTHKVTRLGARQADVTEKITHPNNEWDRLATFNETLARAAENEFKRLQGAITDKISMGINLLLPGNERTTTDMTFKSINDAYYSGGEKTKLADKIYDSWAIKLGGSDSGYSQHEDLHRLVEFIGSGDSTDNAFKKVYSGKSFAEVFREP